MSMVRICQIKVGLVTMENVPTYSHMNISNSNFEVSKCTYLCFSLLLPDTIMTSNYDWGNLTDTNGTYGYIFLKNIFPGNEYSDAAICWDKEKIALLVNQSLRY